jgi:translocation and assembly module TamB
LRLNNQEWSLPDIAVQAGATDAGLDASISGQSPNLTFDGMLRLVGFQADGTIDASIQAQANLNALPVIVPDLTRLEGATTAQVSITGVISEPSITASGEWSDGAIRWANPEIELAQMVTSWSVTGQEWRIEGTGRPTQGGSVLITGEGVGFDKLMQVTANVTGTDIPLASENWQITASPNIDLQIAAEKIRFDGEVDVPQSRIEFKTLPSSLPRPSRDVKVIGRATVAEEVSALSGKVRVKLGDDVRLALFGLDVGLKGQLDAKVLGDELTSLVGELQFYDGSLEASGQILTVEEGRIRFSGDPNTPYVDLLAVRLIEDQSPKLKVGVRITGRTDDLQTAVYSEPSMSETRALSFLVLGRDFNESSEADGSQLISAAIGLGIKQSQGVVQELRGALGLDELSALAADQGDVAIVAGKRLTKDLYVRYTYNAMSAVGALIIRYYLTERWRMEATNDATSSMDFLYEFTK